MLSVAQHHPGTSSQPAPGIMLRHARHERERPDAMGM